jgi:phosphomannomutase
MSQLISPIARYSQSGEINFQIEDKDAALKALKEAYGPAANPQAQMDELDGVTIDLWKTEGWWLNVRKSNTEPLLRLNLEAKDHATLDRMLVQIAPRLGKRVDH